MEETINRFKKEIESIDKFLIIFISLIPLMLAMSIFAADFLASLSGLILIIILFKKKIAMLAFAIFLQNKKVNQ